MEHRCETTSKVLIELSVAVRRGGKGTNRLENEEEKPNVTDGSAQHAVDRVLGQPGLELGLDDLVNAQRAQLLVVRGATAPYRRTRLTPSA